jgi:hypothetical protein
MEEQGVGFWIAVIAAIATVIQTIYVVLSYYRERVMQPQNNLIPKHPHRNLVLLVVLAWVAVGFDYYDRHFSTPQWTSHPLIQVRDRTFGAQTVPLDGYEYVNCDFDDVSFEFQGKAPSRLTDSRIHLSQGKNRVTLRSQNPIVTHTLTIVSALNKAMGITNQELQSEDPLPKVN